MVCWLAHLFQEVKFLRRSLGWLGKEGKLSFVTNPQNRTNIYNIYNIYEAKDTSANNFWRKIMLIVGSASFHQVRGQ